MLGLEAKSLFYGAHIVQLLQAQQEEYLRRNEGKYNLSQLSPDAFKKVKDYTKKRDDAVISPDLPMDNGTLKRKGKVRSSTQNTVPKLQRTVSLSALPDSCPYSPSSSSSASASDLRRQVSSSPRKPRRSLFQLFSVTEWDETSQADDDSNEESPRIGSFCPACDQPLVINATNHGRENSIRSISTYDDEDALEATSYGSPFASGDECGFGWYEDIEQRDDIMQKKIRERQRRYRARHAFVSCSCGWCPNQLVDPREYAFKRTQQEKISAFEICRTFPPLRPNIDLPYATSKHRWLQMLPSNQFIPAKVQIRSFRIVNPGGLKIPYAEYLIELRLDGRDYCRWRRFSDISRFVKKIEGYKQFQQTKCAWSRLEATCRWFSRVELSHLHQRCQLLEHFIQTLLLEATSAHPLADLLDG